ncbi:ParB N-terminal domain-containing protein [Chamaesiphon sp. OTE_75_metabat_556]|uniref:ParB N-terminal domain-containing protein n=1 Tax=Chamaesiphon sp. OTE_75_metabat_556 TaxID=2964692 RepID=UPI00286BA015|nr:ParB N-terminal domain-containing protein [Chamaesiphon sp. OTE_75_metabat_556]
MIKCFFVDVKSIKSDLPKSNFVESELEQLADLILATDGLLRPLILKESGTGKYKVIEGHREYYAAVRAKEKNISKAEMVNAFVIDASNQKSAIAQLALCSESPLTGTTNLTESSQLDRLLPAIESAISEQLQPILVQLAKHTEILDRLTLDRSIPTETTTTIEPIIERVNPQSSETPIPIDRDLPKPVKQKVDRITKSTTKKTTKTVDPTPSINVGSEEISKPLETIEAVTVAKSTKATTKTKSPSALATKSNPKTKSPSAFLGSIDPTKAANVLNLINTLDRQQLTISMERSGLKTIVKLVPAIIEYRNTQPGNQIDRWETILDAKISSLNEAAIKKIIDKLK